MANFVLGQRTVKKIKDTFQVQRRQGASNSKINNNIIIHQSIKALGPCTLYSE
jgi:hypothetical protein